MTASKGRKITKIQREIFNAMVVLTLVLTILIAVVSLYVDLNSERKNLDNNLRNMASAISKSEVIIDEMNSGVLTRNGTINYLDSISETVSNVDVISLISSSGERLYHTNRKLIGTTYDGTIPDFDKYGDIYVSSDVGPSGSQRRVCASIYDRNHNYLGFVIVVFLNQNMDKIVINRVIVHLVVALIVIALSVFLSNMISRSIKHKLLGYEPDAFSAMYSVRDNVLESLEEGVIAIDYDEKILFMNKRAREICNVDTDYSLNLKDYSFLSRNDIRSVMESGEKLTGISARIENRIDALINYYPVIENDRLIGALCVLSDRTEYTKIADDLSGVKFLVQSMRANNHDFTNKLHVILGLIQMGANKEASEYITNITSIQQEQISYIMRNIEDPSLAALLIGKYSRAAELNIDFKIEAGSHYSRSDIEVPSGDLVTLVGNLLENSMEAMNSSEIVVKNLSLGIFTKPGALLIRVDDTGVGIDESIKEKIFENGVTTKGEGHGTGLFLVKQILDRLNGTIEVESELNEGTSLSITIVDDKEGAKDV